MMNKKFEIDLYREILNKKGDPEKYEEDFIDYDLDMQDANGFTIIDPQLKIKSQFQPYNDNRWIDIQLIDKYKLELKNNVNINNSIITGTLTSYINAEEFTNISPKKLPELKWQPNEEAENLILSKNMPIYHNSNKNPFFDGIFLGVIHLPPKDKFLSAEKYYKTLFHELTHSTFPIFDREKPDRLGDLKNCREEIIAELTSLAIINSFGYSKYDESSIYYIDHYKNLPEYKDVFEKEKELILKHVEDAYNLIVSPEEKIDLTDKFDSKYKNNKVVNLKI